MKHSLIGLIIGLLAMTQVVVATSIQPDPFLSYQEEWKTTTAMVDRFQLDFYGSAGLSTSFEDSLEAQWPYSVFGGQAWVNAKHSLNVFSVKAEGQVAYGEQNEAVLTEAYAQHDWRRSSGLGASLLVGQARLAKEAFPRPREAALPRPMDIELPFTENLSGAATGVYWDQLDTTKTALGFLVAGAFGTRRPMTHQTSDTLLNAFPAPEWRWSGVYHIVGYLGPAALHLAWEKGKAHNASLYVQPHPRLSFGAGWTYSLHPRSQIAPDNLYAVKGNWDFWEREHYTISLASGFDFGEQPEAIQAFLGCQFDLPMNGAVEVQLGIDTRYQEQDVVAALRYYWRPGH